MRLIIPFLFFLLESKLNKQRFESYIHEGEGRGGGKENRKWK